MIRSPIPSVPVSFRIDGARHDLGDGAVLRRPETVPGTLRWSLELGGSLAARLRAVAGTPGRPSGAVAARLLLELRPLFLCAGRGTPRFALNTIEQVELGAEVVRLRGRCGPLLLSAGASSPCRSTRK